MLNNLTKEDIAKIDKMSGMFNKLLENINNNIKEVIKTNDKSQTKLDEKMEEFQSINKMLFSTIPLLFKLNDRSNEIASLKQRIRELERELNIKNQNTNSNNETFSNPNDLLKGLMGNKDFSQIMNNLMQNGDKNDL
jgi:predicted nuclease with TOPRIM domain